MSPVGLPEMIGGKYRLRGIVGAGSTGIVYSVEHAFTGELLALKVMTAHLAGSADAVARFKREARAVSRIKSDHVARIFDADVSVELGGAPYLVMDLLDGTDLEKLTGDKPVSPELVVGWLRQAAIPLDKAHRLGIIHRDLKPENLFLTQREDGGSIIKVLDFGIARIAAESVSVGVTQWGQLLGTPLYMAPEQARGDPSHIVPATDLFALGLTTYRLLTGVQYRTASTWEGMLEEILRGPLQAPSEREKDFGSDFDAWFLRACAPDVERRFESARQQTEELARALGLPWDDTSGTERSSVPPTPSFYGPESKQLVEDFEPGPTGTPVPAPRNAETMAASALEIKKSNRGEPVLRNRGRVAFFFGLLLLLLLLGLFLRRHEAAEPTVRTLYSASAAPGSAAPALAPLPSPAAVPSPAPEATPVQQQIAVSAPVPTRRNVPAQVVPRPMPMDDPLGDQK